MACCLTGQPFYSVRYNRLTERFYLSEISLSSPDSDGKWPCPPVTSYRRLTERIIKKYWKRELIHSVHRYSQFNNPL